MESHTWAQSRNNKLKGFYFLFFVGSTLKTRWRNKKKKYHTCQTNVYLEHKLYLDEGEAKMNWTSQKPLYDHHMASHTIKKWTVHTLARLLHAPMKFFFFYIYSNSITKEPFNNLIITKQKKKNPKIKDAEKFSL